MSKKVEIIAEPGKQESFIIREFEAPRELVFRAFAEPELIVKWLGPHTMNITVEKYDSQTHGSYRYFHTGPKGDRYGFNGVIHEVTAPERIIQTFEFEGLPEKGHISLDTTLFEELPGGRTKVTIHSIFRFVADRDGMMASGMERGVNEGYERLDTILEEMK